MMRVTTMWTCGRMEVVRIHCVFVSKVILTADGFAARSVPRVFLRIHNTRHNITKINTPTDQLPGNKALAA